MNPMKILAQSKRLSLQRGFLLCAVLMLLVSNIVLSIVLMGKGDKTIVLPGYVSREFSVEGVDIVSDGYIEQMSMYFAHLLLDLTPQNISYNSSLFLKNVDQKNYFVLVEYFQNKEKTHKNYNLVTRFDVTSLKILKEKGVVEIEGVLTAYFGKDKKIEKSAKYLLNYTIKNGMMIVGGFSQSSGQLDEVAK
jgi:conjugal transfer pilus assembly protein TraE